MRHPLRLAAMTAALVVLPATAALAHPSFNPNQIPTGEAVESVLVIPHGCSTGDGVVPDGADEATATTRFDLQYADGVTIEPGDVDGWAAEDDGEAIVWTDEGGATTDVIELPVTLTATQGAAGDEVLLSAYQECEDGSSYRWTEGADGTPPVRLELTEGEVGTAEMDMDMAHGDGAMDMGSEDVAGDEMAGDEDHGDDMAAEDEDHGAEGEAAEGEEESGLDLADEDLTASAGAQALAGEEADGAFGAIVWIAIALAVLLLVGGVVAVARGRSGT